MAEDKNVNHSSSSLRERAEEVLQGSPEDFALSQLQDIQRLVHELQVHQIELQMQNEELRRTQEELEESRNRYFELFDLAPVAYFTINAKGLIEDVNLTGAALFKRQRAKLLEERFSVFVSPESQKEYYQHRRQVLESSFRQTCELRLVNAEGYSFWAQLDSSASRNLKGDAEAISTAITNVNERVLSEEALKRSETKFRALAESATAGIFIYQDGHVIYANPAIEEIVGYSLRELHSMDYLEFVHPDMRRKIADRAVLVNRVAGIPLRDEVKIVRKGGESGWVEYSAARMDYGGRPAVIGTVVDITERKENEEHLRQSLREKEILLKEVHHRVKNNMQVISSLLNLQAARIGDPVLKAAFRDSQSRVRAMAMIHETLYQSETISRINLRPYLTKLATNLYQTYNTSPARVTLNLDAEDVLLDIDQAIPCGLVLNELITNSLKYAFPENRKGQISLGVHKDGKGNVVLEFGDNGVGLPEDMDIRNTDTLGLSLASKLMERQIGGTIEVSRNNGVYYTLTFTPRLRDTPPLHVSS
jgi:PAS domain S-box-containing protein